MNPNINVILTTDSDGGFSKDGSIPWDFNAGYLKFFEDATRGNICVMGRRTYEEIINSLDDDGVDTSKDDYELLNGRKTYVVSSSQDLEVKGATKVDDLHRVFVLNRDLDTPIFVMGGYRLFIEALGYKPMIYMGIMKDLNLECDRKFPIKIFNTNKYSIHSGDENDECWLMVYKHL